MAEINIPINRQPACCNCGAPARGKDGHGRPICCAHCIFSPLGCRCAHGEPGVPETIFEPEGPTEYALTGRLQLIIEVE